jgi:predicted RNA binding protein YcfA (HicA-like mRNA interferase family)
MHMGLIEAKRVQRLLETVVSTRKNCSFEDLERLLLACGFTSRGGKGSHVIFKRGPLAISVPKRKPVKEHYVEEVLALIYSITD